MMRMSKNLAIAATVMLLGTVPSVAVAGDKSKDAKKDPSRQVCRNIIPTGSRMGTRVCRSASDWDSNSRRQQEDLLRGQQDHTIGYDTGPREGQIN